MTGKYLMQILTLNNLIYGIMVLLVASLVVKYANSASRFAGRQLGRKGHWLEKLTVIIKFTVYAIALYVVVVIVFKPSREASIALLGGMAVAVGFAGQNFLENIFAGIILLFEHPFYVGDRVTAGGFHGDVININVRSTRIKTLDDSFVTLPNIIFIKEGVKSHNAGNISAMVTMDFYFRHQVDVKLVKQILWEAAVTSKYFFPKEEVKILIQEKEWYSEFVVKAYSVDVRKSESFRSDLIYNAKLAFQNYDSIYPDWGKVLGGEDGKVTGD